MVSFCAWRPTVFLVVAEVLKAAEQVRGESISRAAHPSENSVRCIGLTCILRAVVSFCAWRPTVFLVVAEVLKAAEQVRGKSIVRDGLKSRFFSLPLLESGRPGRPLFYQ